MAVASKQAHDNQKRFEAAHGEGCWITAVQLCIV